MMKNKIILSIIIITITAVASGIYFFKNIITMETCICPLEDIKSEEDARSWKIYILNDVQDKVLADISDATMLYKNRREFKIYIDDRVYMSTPQYVVKILKDNKVRETFYILDLKQIDFGTIEQNLISSFEE